ncbi:hypothetical protein J1N35_033360 [Gossypium stocksii]|uniref:Polyphenol oxidase central domain-containing protein n=1 Tax=Gossypium stocksii TaxID=47602 RepID=A0A9D3UQI4_9ROSI|nr:hypothetical protein J1N35_033360 [Gossypium stocksii]
MVHVKVRDCLDSKTLGYAYQSVDIPWLRSKLTPQRCRPRVAQGQDQDKVAVRIGIPRLKKPKNKDDEEVLVL